LKQNIYEEHNVGKKQEATFAPQRQENGTGDHSCQIMSNNSEFITDGKKM